MHLVTLFVVVAATYAFFALFAWRFADSILFQPRPSSYRDGPRITKITADDGTALAAVHLVAPGAKFTMLYLHGNAEDLGDLLPHLEAMQRRGYSVLAFDYRGYGTSPGVPSERNVNADTTAVFRHLTTKLGVPAGDVVVYGRSLGSGPAVELATREKVAGLVLDCGFNSAFRVITRVSLLPGDRFRNLEKLPRVHCPVLVIHATLDGTIPFSHGPRNFAAANDPKRRLWVEGAGHNNLVEVAGEIYWRTLADFAASLAR